VLRRSWVELSFGRSVLLPICRLEFGEFVELGALQWPVGRQPGGTTQTTAFSFILIFSLSDR